MAALQRILVAVVAEVRDSRLPSARLLLSARRADDGGRAGPRDRRDRAASAREPDHRGDDRPRRPAADLRLAVHAVRDVVRSRVEQGPALIVRLSLVAVLALLAASCGGGEQHAPIPPLEPAVKVKVPASHKTAVGYVKRCEAALAKLPIVAVPSKRARVVAQQVAQ